MLGIYFAVMISHAPGGYYYPQGSQMGVLMDVGDLWTVKYNNLMYGHTVDNPISYTWPGGNEASYLYKGGLWVSARKDENIYVSSSFYDNEFESCGSSESSPTGFTFIGPGKSVKDVVEEVCEKSGIGDSIGVRIFERTLSWPTDPYKHMFGHEYMIIFDPDLTSITYDEVYVSVWFDADVCSANGGRFWYNDMTAFDGLYNDAYNEDPRYASIEFKFGREDTLTVLADTTLPGPDGVPDGYFVWGDDVEERVISANAGFDTTNLPTLPDGRKYMYIIPNNTSYLYTDPSVTDEVEQCPGYIFATVVYADPTPNDSTTSGGERFVRVHSHQWWNIETDPGDNSAQYLYVIGSSYGTQWYRFAPRPLDLGSPYFDYRFLLTVGPFENVEPGDTIRFAIVTGVGMGLNGGVDNYWRGGEYLRGVRQLVQYAYRAYYMGSKDSDPGHPDAPNVLDLTDDHWKVPVPPPSPSLNYSPSGGVVKLIWDNKSEITPDPVTNVLDFAGYVVVRSTFTATFKKPTLDENGNVNPGSVLAVIFKGGYSPEKEDSLLAEIFSLPYGTALSGLRDAGVKIYDNVRRSFVDSTASVGFPYFYSVAAFDDPVEGKSLLSSFNNYKKDIGGLAQPVYVSTPPTTDWMNKVRIVPNPFNGSAIWSANKIAQEVEFQNLPPSSRIDIYTLSGDHIQTLYHNDPVAGSVKWNLLTKNGIIIAPGVYIVKITDSDGNYKLLKFMMLR